MSEALGAPPNGRLSDNGGKRWENWMWRAMEGMYSIVPVGLLRAGVELTKNYPFLVERYLRTSSNTSLPNLISRRLAVSAFQRAATHVPAYAEFLRSHEVDPRIVRSAEDFDQSVPQTRRNNYISVYPIRKRCVGGRFPVTGSIDESAGSSGTPVNWVRSDRELLGLRHITQLALDFSFGREGRRPTILINAFSCGAWAGGFRLGAWTESWCLVKNIGPDIPRIQKTLEFLGPEEHYLLAGYPPFLKELVRFLSERDDFDLKSYRIDMMTGGEGFPEGWRTFLESRVMEGARIVSGYGASDLEIGVAGETPYSTGILKAMAADVRLRRALIGTAREPVFFGQFNPGGYYIQSAPNRRGQQEIEVTMLSRHTCSPRIKYCPGDEGGLLAFEDVRRMVREAGLACVNEELALPFLYLFGRSDGTVSIDGANIYPESVASALASAPEIAGAISTFKMGIRHPEAGSPKLTILLRAALGRRPDPRFARVCKESIVRKLIESNADFEESYRSNPESADPLVEVLPFELWPTEGTEARVKDSYFLEEHK
ncbi:MAG: hypothetical protein HYT87_05045 [Nitrospirae bacterium]|nr:hypothetical protein [Nitrospirota bacterium]